MTKRRNRIITYEQDGKAETRLVKAPRVEGNQVVAETPGGQRRFFLQDVLVWVFGGKTHMPKR